MQAILTLSIEAIAIIGITGIIIHAFYNQHTNWMQTNCPPVKPYNPTEPTKEKKAIIPVETPKPSPKPPKNFSKMTLKQLIEICKADKEKYKGYTTIQKKGGKVALAEWIKTKE